MSDIILYIGLPGSGKTVAANQECDIVLDDIFDLSQLPSNEDLALKSLGITDVNFCDAQVLDKATKILHTMYPTKIIDFVYFENNLVKCRANVEHRNDGRNVEGTIVRFEKAYNPPATARKIWSKK